MLKSHGHAEKDDYERMARFLYEAFDGKSSGVVNAVEKSTAELRVNFPEIGQGNFRIVFEFAFPGMPRLVSELYEGFMEMRRCAVCEAGVVENQDTILSREDTFAQPATLSEVEIFHSDLDLSMTSTESEPVKMVASAEEMYVDACQETDECGFSETYFSDDVCGNVEDLTGFSTDIVDSSIHFDAVPSVSSETVCAWVESGVGEVCAGGSCYAQTAEPVFDEESHRRPDRMIDKISEGEVEEGSSYAWMPDPVFDEGVCRRPDRMIDKISCDGIEMCYIRCWALFALFDWVLAVCGGMPKEVLYESVDGVG